MVTMKRLYPLRTNLVVQDRGPQMGLVLAVGPDVRTPDLTAGALIAYPDTAGCLIDLGDYAGRLMDEAEVRAVVQIVEMEDDEPAAPDVTTSQATPITRRHRPSRERAMAR
ncbi:MAG: hypothetical protein ACYC3F_05260 [Gemmatimonadaceae bacterium]